MLRQFGPSTIAAIGLGAVLAVLAFLPVVAVRYRRAGRLRLVDLLVLLGAAVYAVALWTYTLIPLPEAHRFHCQPSQLHLFAFLADIRAEGLPLTANRALFQAAANVLLFVPLGMLLRVLARRGVVVGTLVGFAVSSAIELTQRTGIWGLYRCAYRVFDVDDILLNTFGALIGSILAIPIARAATRAARPRPERVTLGRRLLGMLADLLVFGFLNTILWIGWNVVSEVLLGSQASDVTALAADLIAVVPTLVLEAFWVLVSGRTIGEHIVFLRPVAPPGRWWARPAKLSFGVGGWLALIGINQLEIAIAFAALTGVMAMPTRGHRGLSHLIAGMELYPDVPDAPDSTS